MDFIVNEFLIKIFFEIVLELLNDIDMVVLFIELIIFILKFRKDG